MHCAVFHGIIGPGSTELVFSFIYPKPFIRGFWNIYYMNIVYSAMGWDGYLPIYQNLEMETIGLGVRGHQIYNLQLPDWHFILSEKYVRSLLIFLVNHSTLHDQPEDRLRTVRSSFESIHPSSIQKPDSSNPCIHPSTPHITETREVPM